MKWIFTIGLKSTKINDGIAREPANFIRMILLRLLLIVFNVVVVGFLIYRMIEVIKSPVERWRKVMTLLGGTLLLLAPLGIFLRFFAATPQYFIVYPVAIAMFLYLVKGRVTNDE